MKIKEAAEKFASNFISVTEYEVHEAFLAGAQYMLDEVLKDIRSGAGDAFNETGFICNQTWGDWLESRFKERLGGKG